LFDSHYIPLPFCAIIDIKNDKLLILLILTLKTSGVNDLLHKVKENNEKFNIWTDRVVETAVLPYH